MGTLGSPGLAEHEAGGGARGGGRHPGGDDVASDGLDRQVVTPLLVDRAVVNLIAFLGPGAHQNTLISRVGKV